MGIYINGIDMPKENEILQIRIYGNGKVSRVYDIKCQQIGTAIETTNELVRCEDCKHWTEEKDEEDDILYGWCRVPFENDNLLVYGDDATRIFTAYDFFCKSGERRKP